VEVYLFKEIIERFQSIINEDPDYEQLDESDATDPFQYHIIPVPFNREGKGMLSHLKNLVDDEILLLDGEEFKEVVISLKTASAKEFHLDKNATSYDDLLDALRISVKHFKYEREDSAEVEKGDQSYSGIAGFVSFH
jgi:hypothetical protein